MARQRYTLVGGAAVAEDARLCQSQVDVQMGGGSQHGEIYGGGGSAVLPRDRVQLRGPASIGLKGSVSTTSTSTLGLDAGLPPKKRLEDGGGGMPPKKRAKVGGWTGYPATLQQQQEILAAGPRGTGLDGLVRLHSGINMRALDADAKLMLAAMQQQHPSPGMRMKQQQQLSMAPMELHVGVGDGRRGRLSLGLR